ncbi:MAG: hypothetical protein ABIH83_00115 [Candidatus Micrarchaeota archaeon]
MKEIEDAFSAVTKTILGKSLSPIDDYNDWLTSNLREMPKHKSAISDREMYDPPLVFYKPVLPTEVKLDEAMEIGKKDIGKENALKINLHNASRLLKSILYSTPEREMGQNINNVECSMLIDSSHNYRVISFSHCKLCAYSFWPRQSEYLIGVDTVFSSKFCLKCYNSVNLTRCFETSHSSHCSDCYFCHNCDGLSDCMFCTNVKSMRYAIFNKQYPKEEYMKIKKIVLNEIAVKLEKNKTLDLNIFNIGCYKK